MSRWISCLALLALIAAPALAEALLMAGDEAPVAVTTQDVTTLWLSPLEQALWQAGLMRAEAASAKEPVAAYGGCSVQITCPGSSGPFTIPPYQLSCEGSYSCSVAYNSQGQPCAVVCDGFGKECFPDGCF